VRGAGAARDAALALTSVSSKYPMMSANVGCADWASELDTATMVPTKMADVDSASKTCAAAQERVRARASGVGFCVRGRRPLARQHCAAHWLARAAPTLARRLQPHAP
jgi:hypothetical protein